MTTLHTQDDEGSNRAMERFMKAKAAETRNKDAEESESSKKDSDGNEGGRSLLENLNSDIELYHKKVQLKRKIENSLAKEKEIQENLIREAENSDFPLHKKEKAKEGAEEETKDVEKSGVGPDGGREDGREEEVEVEVDEETADDKKDDVSTNGGIAEEVLESPNSSSTENDHKRRRRGTTIPWNKTEDDAIVYYKEEMKYSWKRIEELLKGRHSWQAIQMRYLRNHKSRNEEWSRYMEIKLINHIRKDWENRWKRISQELGKDFSVERCVNKNVEICKKMEMPYYASVFENKEITAGYDNPFHDIKDPEQHKKLMLVYMGLDSISYEDSDNEAATANEEAIASEPEKLAQAAESAQNQDNQTEDAEKERSS
ncbi:DEKNAAC103373 [Brettanomyces naardenensis]|uniref:DEKNAAC103373 n=1 Tax=Brettanomyces naardenensis TaxID=13370 RepID=A0A448YNZ0_BRENA|nr:DEKNAAC103373 [Brettanomyces naardenensis]